MSTEVILVSTIDPAYAPTNITHINRFDSRPRRENAVSTSLSKDIESPVQDMRLLNNGNNTHETAISGELLDESELVDFPDGGLKAWLIVFGSWCAMFATFGVCNSTGYLQTYLKSNQLHDKTESQISWIFSIYLFLFYFGGVQVGPIFDTFGLRWVLVPGCIGTVLSLFMFSICEEYYQFILSFGILGGISSSLVFTPSVAVIGHWFYKKRGLATGIAATGGALGGVAFPLALNSMMGKIGFGWSIRVIAFILVVLSIGAIGTLRTRISDAHPAPDGKRKKHRGGAIDITAVKDNLYLLTCIATFFTELALFIPLTYISSYALEQGVGSNFSYELLPILNSFSVFGRSLPGYVADKWGRFNTMTVTAAVCAISCLAIWLPASNNKGAMIAFACMFGFWSGTGICLTPVCISQICRTEDYGKRYGTVYFFVSFGTLIGLPIAGAILKSHSRWDGLIIFSAIVYLAGAIFFGAARIYATGWKLRVIY